MVSGAQPPPVSARSGARSTRVSSRDGGGMVMLGGWLLVHREKRVVLRPPRHGAGGTCGRVGEYSGCAFRSSSQADATGIMFFVHLEGGEAGGVGRLGFGFVSKHQSYHHLSLCKHLVLLSILLLLYPTRLQRTAHTHKPWSRPLRRGSGMVGLRPPGIIILRWPRHGHQSFVLCARSSHTRHSTKQES